MDMGTFGGMPQEVNGCSDPGIIVDPETGEIFCSAVWMNGKAGKHQWNKDGSEPGFEIGKSAQFMLVRSQDDGTDVVEAAEYDARVEGSQVDSVRAVAAAGHRDQRRHVGHAHSGP